MRTGFVQTVAMALRGLAATPLRTALSTLGVIVGVGALVAVFALTDGLEAFSRAQLEETTDLQLVTVAPITADAVNGYLVRRSDPITLTADDARDLDAHLASSAVATLTGRTSDWITISSDTSRIAVTTWHTMASAVDLLPTPLAEGRFLQPDDEPGAGVAVVSGELARRIVEDTDRGSAIGYRLAMPWQELEIVGVLEADSARSMAMVFVPYGVATDRLASSLAPMSITVKVLDVEKIEATVGLIDEWIGQRFAGREDALRLSSNQSRARQAKMAMTVFKIVMGSIAGISLIVGGIGIMNVLMASVSERTREIGIRKAAGARRRDIGLQFLAESILISGFGSLVGVIAGMGAAIVVTTLAQKLAEAPIPVKFTPESLLIAVGAAVLIGLIFGTWPARRASRLSPIEAIRQD